MPPPRQEEQRQVEDTPEASIADDVNRLQEAIEAAEIAITGETTLSKSTMSVAKLLKMPLTLIADALSQILSFFASITDFFAKVIGKSPQSTA